MRSLPRKVVLPLLLAAWGILAGCDNQVNHGGEISGMVTIDGAPVTAGNILFVSENGQQTAIGPIKGDGSWSVKEPPLGKVAIAVQTEHFRNKVPLPKNATTGAPPRDVGSPGMVLPKSSERGLIYKAIPGKYEKAETSGLKHVVERGKVTLNLELTTP